MAKNRIPQIRRAVIVLDQVSGALRSRDNGETAGIDLWQDPRQPYSGLRELEVILAVPAQAGQSALIVEGLQVVALDGAAGSGGSRLADSGRPTAVVSADRKLRGEAVRAGLYPAPHPSLLPLMMSGELPEAARLVGGYDQLMRLADSPGLVPLHFQPVPDCPPLWALIALAPASLWTRAALDGMSVGPLAYDPMTDDLVWIRVDRQNRAEVAEHIGGRQILYSEPGQILLALGPDDGAEAVDAHGAHGHREVLVPSPELLRPPVMSAAERQALAPWPLPAEILIPVVPRPPGPILPSCSTVTASYESDLNRYTGVAALDSMGPVNSRHIAHPGNARVETQLLKDLRAMGYCPVRHNFVHAGKTYSNIIADLPGTGTHSIRPEILKRYKEITAQPPDRLALEEFAYSLGASADEFAGAALSDREIREQVERALQLAPWYPWWRSCALPGLGSDLVIVGCHLDSTAASHPGYQAATHAAPGRDDNGSGMAGVLAMARHLWSLRGRLTHTVRFSFFNAEEAGLVGSKAYAANLKAMNAPIRGVICMDMIGYNSDAQRLFEIHAGYTDPVVRDRSVLLAPLVANAAAAYGTLAAAQVYKGLSLSGGPNRSVFDGAINRSDHAAFHQQGYGAILISEDFFANLASEPSADPNPNYHRPGDTVVDLSYARAIVCAVSQAVVKLAR